METELIKQTITKNYVHGAFNQMNIDAFKDVFHPEFAIINVQEDGRFFLFTRSMWEDVLQKRIADPDFDYNAVALTPRFRSIEVVANKANVTLDLLRAGKTIYTDFLLLTKQDGRWQIVSKVFHEYE